MNIVENARTYLASHNSLTSILGYGEGWGTWIFQDEVQATLENSSLRRVPNSMEYIPGTAVVISHAGAWASSNRHNSAEFPRLRIEIWADPDRLPDGSVDIQNAQDKIIEVFKKVDYLLHLTGRRVVKDVIGNVTYDSHRWGNMDIISCERLDGSLEFSRVTDGNGLRSATVHYGVQTA